jgi:hypothetical protein
MGESIVAVLTALGLSTAAGLNPYLPLLITGALARTTDLLSLAAPYDRLEDPWVLLAIAAIGSVDFVGDKIPVVDHVLHAAGVLIAPVAGALVALAVTGSDAVDPSIALVLGVAAAGATHTARATARPAATALTAGAANPVLSLGEDAAAAVLSLTAVVVPLVALGLVLALFGCFAWVLTRTRRRRDRRRRDASAQRR